MHLLEGADRAGPDHLGDPASLFTGLTEISHLRGHLGLARDLADHAGLINAVRERFLTVNMLAEFHGHGRRDGMDVVGGGDEHGVDVLLRLQHLAEVGVELGPRVFPGAGGQVVVIGIAEGDNVLAGLGA
jgi:hypothetical protein